LKVVRGSFEWFRYITEGSETLPVI
jgi:hypothetical protein